jgi:hypothetical protein
VRHADDRSDAEGCLFNFEAAHVFGPSISLTTARFRSVCKREKLEGKLQQLYAHGNEQAKKEIDDFLGGLK